MPTVRQEVVDALLEAYAESQRAADYLTALESRFTPSPTAVERIVARDRRRDERALIKSPSHSA